MKFSKFFKRLILFSLLIGTLPVILLGIFSYIRSSSIIQDKVNRGNVQILMENQMGIEQVLKTLDDAVRRFLCSPIVADSMLLKLDPDNYQIFNELSRNLFLVQNSGINIRDINLINLDKGWFMCFRGLYSLEDYPDKAEIDKYVDFNETSFWICEENNARSDTGKNYINFVKKIPVNSLRPDGLIIIKIPYSELDKFLSRSHGFGKGMILDQDLKVIAHENYNILETMTAYRGFIGGMSKLDTPVGYFELNEGMERYGITCAKSNYNNWTYLNISSINEMTKDTKAIGWFTLLICMLIMLSSAAISLMGSKRIYSPIRTLYNLVQKLESKNEWGFDEKDEIKAIGDKINILVNTQSQMKNAIEVQQEQLKEFFLMKLLQGKLKTDNIKSQLKSFDYPVSMKWLCILTIQIDSFEDIDIKEQDLIAYAVNNIVCELVQLQYRIGVITIDQYQVIFLGGRDEDCDIKNHIYDLAQLIQKIIEDCLGLKTSIGISRLFCEFRETHTAYMKTIEALKYKIPAGRESIIYAEDIQPGYPMHFSFLRGIQNEILEAIKLADREKARVLLRQFINQVFENGLASNQFRYVFLRLMTHFVSLAEVLGENPDSFYNDNMLKFDRLFEFKSPYDIEKWLFNTMMEPLMRLFEESRGSQYRKISMDVINMICREYETDLTLEKCAEKLNYHPGYISRVFSSEVGITFSEYLSKYRMETAKKWLAQSDMKIQEISERLRYNNPQNFIRQFRKQEGLTPGEFRKKYSSLGKVQSSLILNI